MNATHILDDENNLVRLSAVDDTPALADSGSNSQENLPSQSQPASDQQSENAQPTVVDESRLLRAWWKASADAQTYHGWPETIDYLRRIFAQKGPFDGILCKSIHPEYNRLVIEPGQVLARAQFSAPCCAACSIASLSCVPKFRSGSQC